MRKWRDLTAARWHKKVLTFHEKHQNRFRWVLRRDLRANARRHLEFQLEHRQKLSPKSQDYKARLREALVPRLLLLRRNRPELKFAEGLSHPARRMQSTLHELETSIRLATSGSNRHAWACLEYFCRIEPRDARILCHIEEARRRYNTDSDRPHRGVERALWLLDSKGGGKASTPDQRAEARLLYHELRQPGAKFSLLDECGHCQDLKNNSQVRLKAKRGMSKGHAIEHIAALIRTTPRTVERWLTAAAAEPE
ncbi:MAG: hypothetical protein ACREU3_17325 [Steroidobacteraceae bacterium]